MSSISSSKTHPNTPQEALDLTTAHGLPVGGAAQFGGGGALGVPGMVRGSAGYRQRYQDESLHPEQLESAGGSEAEEHAAVRAVRGEDDDDVMTYENDVMTYENF